MFRIDAYSNEIYITRGDNAPLTVELTDDNGEVYEIEAADTLTFTVKNTVNHKINIIQKTVTGSNEFEILPEDTKPLKFGKYVYDVQLTMADGKIYTVIPPSKFIVGEEVTE